MEGIDKDYLRNEIEDFKERFCPYGYWDIEKAVRDSIEAGHGAGWAFEQLEEFSESCGIKLENIDPCYVVMDAILQEARDEIDSLMGFDLQNDAGFDVYGNFMGSVYHYRDEDVDLLKMVLVKHHIKLGRLSDASKWFLSAVEIDLDELQNEND